MTENEPEMLKLMNVNGVPTVSETGPAPGVDFADFGTSTGACYGFCLGYSEV